MQVGNKKVAAISYKLSSIDKKGTKVLLENVDASQPMFFLVGVSGLPPKFEESIHGLKKGDGFDFSLNSADAFGEFHEDEIINLPIEEFLEEDGTLDKEKFRLGSLVPMVDEEGHHVRGTIIEINETKKYIKMDFNHPLAGKDLHFEGKVELVRDATNEELDHGHVHGEGGHHH